MKTIEIDDDLFVELEKRAKGFGATPNSILREVLSVNTSPLMKDGSETNSPSLAAGDENFKALAIAKTPQYVSGNGQRKYLLVLSAIHEDFPDEFGKLIDFQYGSRKHFARTIEEIENSGSNTAAMMIPNTNYAALTNLQSDRKKKIIADILNYFDYPEDVKTKILESIPNSKPRMSRLSKIAS